MAKLTNRQLVILSAAMKRGDGAVLPLPATLTLNKGAAVLVLKSLLKHELIAERPTGIGAEIWRETDDGQRLGLVITGAGLNAMGIDPDDRPDTLAAAPQGAVKPAAVKRSTGAKKQPAADGKAPRANKASAGGPSARPGTRQAQLLDLLRRKKGATVNEIMTATGWQAHSVRGAISGLVKTKLGLRVDTEVTTARGRVYRVVEGAR